MRNEVEMNLVRPLSQIVRQKRMHFKIRIKIGNNIFIVLEGRDIKGNQKFYMLKRVSQSLHFKKSSGDFPGGAVVENLPANAWDTSSSPGPGRSHMPRSN